VFVEDKRPAFVGGGGMGLARGKFGTMLDKMLEVKVYCAVFAFSFSCRHFSMPGEYF